MFEIPSLLLNRIAGEEKESQSKRAFEKLNPHTGKPICEVTQSNATDVQHAVEVSGRAFAMWSLIPAVKRGEVLFEIAAILKKYQLEMARVVSLETGKSVKDATGEVAAAISQAQFMAAEGQRLFGRTTVSGVTNRYPMTVREPIGVVGLIGAANTPIANIAWKVFPALISGNSAVVKSAEDTPLTAHFFTKLCEEAGLPPGVLNLIHGLGNEAGAALVENPNVPLISFTGSTRVGKWIAETTAKRLARTSLELGGKNPMVICEDADLDNAVKWAVLSSFSNAGQRCASSSRIIVLDGVYEEFKKRFIKATEALKVGPTDSDDFGPVINERQLKNMEDCVLRAKNAEARILIGGSRLKDPAHQNGFYFPATILENVGIRDEISNTELFGPITCLYRALDFADALRMANNSDYGLTACIHTSNINRALEFTRRVQAGVAVINAGTYGSEPHMPFGGVKLSGNGTREPGPEAIDVYTNLKAIYQNVDLTKL